jgi:hypothetical protein
MTDYTTNNATPVARLLRTIAQSKGNHFVDDDEGKSILFDAAADICEMHVAIMKELEDVPGETALERVQRLKKWYQDAYQKVIPLIQGRT